MTDTDNNNPRRFEQMIREMSAAFFRVTGIEPTPEQVKTVELTIRAEFAGERVYIAGHPKAQRAKQIAALRRQSTRKAAAELGISQRRVQQLIK